LRSNSDLHLRQTKSLHQTLTYI